MKQNKVSIKQDKQIKLAKALRNNLARRKTTKKNTQIGSQINENDIKDNQ